MAWGPGGSLLFLPLGWITHASCSHFQLEISHLISTGIQTKTLSLEISLLLVLLIPSNSQYPASVPKEESRPSEHIPTPLTWLLHWPLYRPAWHPPCGRLHSPFTLVTHRASPHTLLCFPEFWVAILRPINGAQSPCRKGKGRDSFAWSFKSAGPALLGFPPLLPVEKPPTPSSYPTMRTYSFPARLLAFLLLHELGLNLKTYPSLARISASNWSKAHSLKLKEEWHLSWFVKLRMECHVMLLFCSLMLQFLYISGTSCPSHCGVFLEAIYVFRW